MVNNKEEKSKAPEKIYYDVKLEVMVPGTVTYRILAESPEQAIQLIKYQQPRQIQYRINAKKIIKTLVYKAASVLLLFSKNG